MVEAIFIALPGVQFIRQVVHTLLQVFLVFFDVLQFSGDDLLLCYLLLKAIDLALQILDCVGVISYLLSVGRTTADASRNDEGDGEHERRYGTDFRKLA